MQGAEMANAATAAYIRYKKKMFALRPRMEGAEIGAALRVSRVFVTKLGQTTEV